MSLRKLSTCREVAILKIQLILSKVFKQKFLSPFKMAHCINYEENEDDDLLIGALAEFEKTKKSQDIFLDKYTKSNVIGESKTVSGMQPEHREVLQNMRKRLRSNFHKKGDDVLGGYSKTSKFQKVKYDRKKPFQINNKYKNDPNFDNWMKMLNSERECGRDSEGFLHCVFCEKNPSSNDYNNTNAASKKNDADAITSVFRQKFALRRHYIEQHYEKCPAHWYKPYYECLPCDATFKRSEHFRSHIRSFKHLRNSSENAKSKKKI